MTIDHLKSKLVVTVQDQYATITNKLAIQDRLDEIKKRAAEIGAPIDWKADQKKVTAVLSLPL